MPVPYAKLRFEELMYHKGAYDLIDKEGKKFVPDWDMVMFEKYIFGTGDMPKFRSPEDMKRLLKGLPELDKSMPFLKFGEKGQHYAYELFLSRPLFWGSRGAPLFWAYAAREFTYDKLPMDAEKLRSKYMNMVHKFGIPFGKDEYVYIPRFDANGMSGGAVGGIFAEEGLKTLLHRLRMYN